MEKLFVTGGNPIQGTLSISGAKNVALKLLVASLLTDETLTLHNVPAIGDVAAMMEILEQLGVTLTRTGSTVVAKGTTGPSGSVPLDVGARLRASSLVIAPLLARHGEAIIPNPGGCRLGARPIDRHIDALKQLGATITYNSDDGFFHAKSPKLQGATIRFPKNTHTGTETLILAAVLARGTTTLANAAEEVEIDDLIACLNAMGARITRTQGRTIVIEGVDHLYGAEFSIMPDRNEEVTFAIAAAMTDGNLTIKNSAHKYLDAFFESFALAGGGVEILDESTARYFRASPLKATHITTGQHPGFMTDWQAPWAVFMTQATGTSTIHETVFESRFSYVAELKKMGAYIDFFDPPVDNPAEFYNFNWADRVEGSHQAIRIDGVTPLHNAILTMNDLRAGATLILAALVAAGESVIHGIEQVDRGYERIEERLASAGAAIRRVKEDYV